MNTFALASIIAACDPRIIRRANVAADSVPAHVTFESVKLRMSTDAAAREANHIERGVHQIDLSRAPSESPIMPSIQLARETGNAFYPTHEQCGDAIVTAAKYLPRVALAHHAFALFAARGNATAAEIVGDAEKLSGYSGKYALETVRDVLRDCALFGLASYDRSKRVDSKSTRFTYVDARNVPTLGEHNAESVNADASQNVADASESDASSVAETKRSKRDKRSQRAA